MSKSIFTITTLYINNAGIASTRCVGFEFSKQMAIDMVIGNYGDIHEGNYYSHCIIEEYGVGMYPHPKSFLWFKWDNDADRFIHCCVPEGEEQVRNYGIG